MAWDLEVRPHRTTRLAIAFAVALVLFFILVGVLLRRSDTGVFFQPADQAAMVVLGFILAGAVLLFTRPRLRADASGVRVRTLFTEKAVDWDLVQDLTFPDGAAWARIELPDDEYLPVLAIQANDRERAVDAVRRFRALGDKYAGQR